MPVTFGHRAVWPKGLCGAILLAFVLVLVIAAMATPIAVQRKLIPQTSDYLARQVDFGPFQTCQDHRTARVLDTEKCFGTHKSYELFVQPPTECKKYDSFIYSIMFFYLATAVFVVLALIACIFNAVGKVTFMVPVALVVVAMICALISWTLALSWYMTKQCDQQKMYDDPTYAFGPSLFLMLCAFAALAFAALAVLCMMEKGPHDGGAQRATPPPKAVTPPPPPAPRAVTPPKKVRAATPPPVRAATPAAESDGEAFDL